MYMKKSDEYILLIKNNKIIFNKKEIQFNNIKKLLIKAKKYYHEHLYSNYRFRDI